MLPDNIIAKMWARAVTSLSRYIKGSGTPYSVPLLSHHRLVSLQWYIFIGPLREEKREIPSATSPVTKYMFNWECIYILYIYIYTYISWRRSGNSSNYIILLWLWFRDIILQILYSSRDSYIHISIVLNNNEVNNNSILCNIQ